MSNVGAALSRRWVNDFAVFRREQWGDSFLRRSMLSLKELLDLWGFSEHPFESYTAEKEVRLTDYFVKPPYLDDVLGTAESAAPAIVFGSRGIGKSAIRIYVENLCVQGDPENLLHGRVVAVTYDNFRSATKQGIDKIALEDHMTVIVQKMVCAALIRVARRLKVTPSKEAISAEFPNLDMVTFPRLVTTYFTSLSELQRESAFRGVYDYFQHESATLADRSGWFQKMWATLRVPLFDLANLIQAIRGKDAIAPTPLPKTKAPPKEPEVSVLEDFQALAAMAPSLGIDAWYVLIDKVDEDDHTDGDAVKAAHMIMPLLKALRVIETPRVAFKFFLWGQLRSTLIEQKVRLDKLRNFEMKWTDDELREMTNRRLMAFSNDSVKDFRQLVEAREVVFDLVLKYAMRSPREIVHVIDAIFREHARHSTQQDGAMITMESIDRGLDEYCMRRVRDVYPPEVIRRIARMTTVFTSSDFTAVFKCSQSVASTTITKWSDNGYVRRIADARSKKDPSKAVYQYEVAEPRLRRILERGLEKPDDAE